MPCTEVGLKNIFPLQEVVNGKKTKLNLFLISSTNNKKGALKYLAASVVKKSKKKALQMLF